MSECWTRSAEGNRAHFGLAVACAKRFQGRGVPMEELIGEAEAALLWAASRFDEKRGVRFSTYAIPFALGALRELCRRNAPMNIPREELRLLTAAERRREEWQQENGREPKKPLCADSGEGCAAKRMRCRSGSMSVCFFCAHLPHRTNTLGAA